MSARVCRSCGPYYATLHNCPMTASQPLPLAELSPAELAEIERFGIYEAEEKVEKVARALEAAPTEQQWLSAHDLRVLARAAVAAMPASRAACGDLSPTINFGGDSDAERLMCDLPVDHGGAHQHDNGDGLPPTRWIAAHASPAEEALRRVKALAERLGDESREFYYDNRHTHEYGISYVSGMSDGMEQIADRITAAIAAPQTGEHTTDEEGR